MNTVYVQQLNVFRDLCELNKQYQQNQRTQNKAILYLLDNWHFWVITYLTTGISRVITYLTTGISRVITYLTTGISRVIFSLKTWRYLLKSENTLNVRTLDLTHLDRPEKQNVIINRNIGSYMDNECLFYT